MSRPRREVAKEPTAGSCCPDPLGTFERLQANNAEDCQESSEEPHGVGDYAFRDPAPTIRIQELAEPCGKM